MRVDSVEAWCKQYIVEPLRTVLLVDDVGNCRERGITSDRFGVASRYGKPLAFRKGTCLSGEGRK